MKKLLFATAIAASAAAFADGPINATAFANPGEYNPNAANTENSYFYFAGDSDSSVVTNGSPSTTKHTANFATAEDANYLALDTEGGTLWRSLATITSTTVGEDTTYDLGAARAVAATGTYLDTLVQFTVTEDEAPEVGADDKLAIWLQAGEGTTNLMVKANYWATVSDDPVATDFTVSGVSIEPGTWYRLTVKAIPSITTQGAPFPAFQIFIDGTAIAATTSQYDEEFQDVASARYAEGIGDLIEKNKLFPTLAERPSSLEDVTLQGVGFQGTGAVDEIVWTEEDPFPPAVVEFTLTQSIGENVTAVAFTIGEDAITFENNAASVVSNATVTIARPTFAEGYRLAALTVDGTPVSDPEFPYSFTMTADTTVAITAEEIPSAEDWVDNPTTDITAGQTAAQAYPGLASSALATADAQKLTTWAKANGINYSDIKDDTTGTYVDAYLLNCHPDDVDDEKEEFVANITIGADGTPTVTKPTDKDYNGTLKLQGATSLTVPISWTDMPNNTATKSYNFYRFVLEL